MENLGELTVILIMSTIIWILVDRFKPAWSNLEVKEVNIGGAITTLVAAVLAVGAVVTYNYDIIKAMGVASETTVFGQILTVISFVGGSSIVAEVANKIKQPEEKLNHDNNAQG